MYNNDNRELKAVFEAMLFLSNKPLTAQHIKRVFEELKPSAIEGLLREIAQEYEQRGSGLEIVEIAGGFQSRTRPDISHWLKKFQSFRPVKLSRPAMESLAIIAYKQPITRHEIEEIRGVDCGGVIKTLLDFRLIKIMGRKKIPGNPMIYGTSREFLELFQLRELSELPDIEGIIGPAEGDEQLSFDLFDEPEEKAETPAENNKNPYTQSIINDDKQSKNSEITESNRDDTDNLPPEG